MWSGNFDLIAYHDLDGRSGSKLAHCTVCREHPTGDAVLAGAHTNLVRFTQAPRGGTSRRGEM
jgi:hypothetical protein